MLCWGVIPIFLRFFIANEGLEPWAVNAVRYLIGTLCWVPVVAVLVRRGEDGAAGGRSIWRDARVPAAINVVAQATYGICPAYATAPTIGFVLRLSFLFTLLFGLVFVREERRLVRRPTFPAGVLLCLAGVVAMFWEGLTSRAGASATGMAILILSTVGWGGYAVSVRRYTAGYPARLGFGVISLYTAGGLLVLGLAFGRPASLAHATAGIWAALAVSSVLGVTLGHVLYYRAIHRLGPVVSVGVLLAQPFVTDAGAALFLGETLTWMQTLGGVAEVGGGALLLAAEATVEPGARPPEPAAD
jgi:drug/metabolite transporter (DMT)-like permease